MSDSVEYEINSDMIDDKIPRTSEEIFENIQKLLKIEHEWELINTLFKKASNRNAKRVQQDRLNAFTIKTDFILKSGQRGIIAEKLDGKSDEKLDKKVCSSGSSQRTYENTTTFCGGMAKILLFWCLEVLQAQYNSKNRNAKEKTKKLGSDGAGSGKGSTPARPPKRSKPENVRERAKLQEEQRQNLKDFVGRTGQEKGVKFNLSPEKESMKGNELVDTYGRFEKAREKLDNFNNNMKGKSFNAKQGAELKDLEDNLKKAQQDLEDISKKPQSVYGSDLGSLPSSIMANKSGMDETSRPNSAMFGPQEGQRDRLPSFDLLPRIKEYELSPEAFDRRRSGSTTDFGMYGILDTPNAERMKEGSFFDDNTKKELKKKQGENPEHDIKTDPILKCTACGKGPFTTVGLLEHVKTAHKSGGSRKNRRRKKRTKKKKRRRKRTKKKRRRKKKTRYKR